MLFCPDIDFKQSIGMRASPWSEVLSNMSFKADGYAAA